MIVLRLCEPWSDEGRTSGQHVCRRLDRVCRGWLLSGVMALVEPGQEPVRSCSVDPKPVAPARTDWGGE